MTKKIGSSFLFLFCTFFLFNSCQSSEEKDHSLSSLSLNEMKKNEENALFTKIQNDYDLNKLTEVEVNEAFLSAKSYEYKGQYEKAEKLFDIIYKFSPNIPVAFNLIQIKVNLKKLSEAKEIAKHAHVIFPKNDDILLMLIQIYQMEGNQVQVTHLLDEGVKQFPKNESFAILYAYYNYSDAKKILISFLARTPSSPNVLLKLSTLYYSEKNYIESLKLAKKSYSLDSDNIETITIIAKNSQILKNNAEAESFYRLAFEKEMENNTHAQNYINILLTQKKQQEALSVLLRLEASSDASVPFPPEFTFEIGRILILNEDYIGAKTRFQSLLNRKPTSNLKEDEVYFFLAYTLENLHEFKDALLYFEKIQPESHFYSVAGREKIITIINSGDHNKASELMKDFKILKDNYYSENVLFYSSLLIFYNKSDEALALLNEAIKTKPDEKEFYLKRLEIYFTSKKDDAFVLKEAMFIAKKWPNYSDGLNMVAYLLVNFSKNLSYAEKLLKKVYSIDSKNPYYLDSLGCLYLKKNNLLLAQGFFLDSLKYSPNEPVILYHYAQVLFLLKKDQEAEKILDKARTIISNMLIYSVGSDYELRTISKLINKT